MTVPTPRPSRLLKLAAVLAPWVLGLVLGIWLVVGMAWGALHGWIVPRIGEFRPQLESAASRALGAEVRIGAISASSAQLLPSFELTDVVLRDAAGREGLRLAKVSALLSPRSLVRLGFEQLVVDGPVLDLRRTADGRLLVAGIALSDGGGDSSRAADWIFSQRELAVRQATVRWTDERLGRPAVELTQADLVIRNGARRHRIRFDATPPADWGERFSLRAAMRQSLLNPRRGNWREWDGPIYAEFPQLDLAQLRAHLAPALAQDVELLAGRGGLRAWVDVVHGAVLGGQFDLALQDASARLGPDLEPLALAELQGRLRGRLLASGMELETEQLRFATADGAQWPEGDVFLSYMRGESRVRGQGELRAGRIDLAALAEVAGRLPLAPDWRAQLQALAPQGRIEQLQAQWTGRIEAPASYRVQGRLRDLALAAGPIAPSRPDLHYPMGRPGVAGLAAEFTLTQGGGEARLALADGALEFPGVFEEARVPLAQLEGQVRWQHDGERLAVQVPELRFANADAAGQLQARWSSRPEPAADGLPHGPGVLELDGRLTRADGTRVHRYLPLAVGDEARHYVRDAVQRGRASSVQFKVRGDLDHFPYKNPKLGEFHIAAEVEDVHYAYVPTSLQDSGELPWPALTSLAGRLVFDRNGMQVRNARGQLADVAGFAVAKAEADIADFDKPEVAVRAEGRGPLTGMLAAVAGSPLAQMTEGALAEAQASGAGELKLQLALPLERLEASRVQGSVQLAGNDIRLRPGTPLLARTRGAVAFSESGFTLAGVQAAVLGGETRVDGGLQAGALALRVQGTVTAEGLRQLGELGSLARLARRASGGAAYTAALTRGTDGALAFTLDSPLQGLGLDLPAPLAKPAEANWPLRLALAPQARAQDRISLQLGTVLQAQFERDTAGTAPRVLRGSIALGLAADEAAALPAEGVSANLRLDSVAVEAWQAVADGLAEEPATAAAAPGGIDPGYLPDRFAVRANELRWGGRRLHQLVLGGSREGSTWRANIDARELGGYLEYRPGAASQPGSVHARLARLAIASGEEEEVTTLLDEQPSSVPALDIVVDDFELRGKKLGRLEMNAVNQGAEWQLHKLALRLPEARFEASGQWGARGAGAAGPGRRTAMDFRLHIDDAGALLTRLGMAGVFRRGNGQLDGSVAWDGSPLALDYPSMTGRLHLDVREGQFLKADAGPARLLGVLSLQALPRRLTLDFRDLFSEGFAFDFVRGDAQIARGVVSSNNLQMKGISAAVLMDGRADIARETQDLRVVVVPEINAGTASLVATVINPAIGLGSFLAQWVLRRPLMEAATQQFHIDGTWSDPRIERVARSAPSAQAEDNDRKGAVR
ncbi:YhdP family protein [Pseudorhodoferax sp.]|uniref:YhdP family protein n=1 Tax=Pseudorhodoferax sp. TaxID=1993553 RepID=UPI002DD689F6|nr:YhdP family protein [Pseudorhodoferax sp.]